MKFKLYKELLSESNILSHVFMECVPKKMLDKIADDTKKAMDADTNLTTEEVQENRVIEIKLFIEGEEVDLRKFFDTLWEQYETIVKKTATSMVQEQTSDKLNEISDQIMQLRECADDLTKQINWEVENPFDKKT